MPADLITGASLGSVSVFFNIYDSCKRLYAGCQNMRHFGGHARLQFAKLRVQSMKLDALIQVRLNHLKHPPDTENDNHPATKAVKEHLSIIKTHFDACHKIIANVLHHSGYMLREDGVVWPLTDSPATPSLVSAPSSVSSGSSVRTPPSTDPGVRPEKDRGFLGVKKSSLRKLSPGRLKRKKDISIVHVKELDEPAPETHIAVPEQEATPSLEEIPDRGRLVPSIQVEGIAKADDESRQVRNEASWWTLVKWNDHNKRDMECSIDQLRTSIGDLKDYLELQQLPNPERNLEVVSPQSYVPRTLAKTLESAHNALRSVNPHSGLMSKFSVSIANSSKDNRALLADYPGMAAILQPESEVIFVQRHDSRPGQSTFLAIEAGAELPDIPRLIESTIDNVSILVPPSTQNQATVPDRYSRCGSIKSSSVQQQVFVEAMYWHVGQSFSQCLEDEAFKAGLTTRALVQVFRTLMIAFLDFERVRDVCRYPRLEDYIMFERPVYDDALQVTEPNADDVWQAPYWSCGFGAPGPLRVPGASAIGRERDSAVVELGLVLFQLATRSKAVYAPSSNGQQKTWRIARRQALKTFQDVSTEHGLSLANIVESCLQANAQTDKTVLCSALSSLDNLLDELDDADLH